MTSIYFPREDSLGFSDEEFQLEGPVCGLSSKVLVSAAAQKQYQWSEVAWALKKKGRGGGQTNDPVLHLFQGTFHHFGVILCSFTLKYLTVCKARRDAEIASC